LTESQIISILKREEAGVPMAGILRQHNMYAGAAVQESEHGKATARREWCTASVTL
jgi:hypothetical protein